MPNVRLFSSSLAASLQAYVDLKRALGRRFDAVTHTLISMDRFLKAGKYKTLDSASFEGWCRTHGGVASGVRRARMRDVRNFCLHHKRIEPDCFVPDLSTFPAQHQRILPHILSETDVARLLNAAAGLKRRGDAPLRPEMTRLAIVLLYTTGLRRGELLNLIVRDYDSNESTLHVRETKFFKSRILPLNAEIAEEIDRYLQARAKRGLPTSPDTKMIRSMRQGGQSYKGPALRSSIRLLLKECHIATAHGKLPRIHDFRHRADSPVMPTSRTAPL
jgi:integrase/recombinase XerD